MDGQPSLPTNEHYNEHPLALPISTSQSISGEPTLEVRLANFSRTLEQALRSLEDTETREAMLREYKMLCGKIKHADAILLETQLRSEALARAQADAIVHSAEIIQELEETKLCLSEARNAAEQAAKDTQRLAHTIFERTHDTVLVLREGNCISCNDNAFRLFGCTADEIVSQWPQPFLADNLVTGWDGEQRLRNAYLSACSGQTESLEIALLHPHNQVLWCEITMTNFDMHEAVHVLATVRDITARHRFEEELRRHRDFLDNIINAVPDLLTVSDEQHRLVLANDTYCKTLGLARQRIIGHRLRDVFPGDEGLQIEAAENSTLQTEKVYEEERTHQDCHGEQRVHSVRRSSFHDLMTGEKYVVSSSRDITDDCRREEKIALLASVFNSAAEGIAILTREGCVIEANPRFLEMCHGEPAVAGEYLPELINLDFDGFTEEIFRVAQGNSWSGKVSVPHANDGQQRWYLMSLSRTVGSEKSPRIIALFSDVTQLENSQQQLQEQALHDNLTGLPNRRYFKQYVDHLITDCNGIDVAFSVCFMDLDDFKSVNDSLGHSVGDQLLVAVTKRLRGVLSKHAFIARFGGDEFAAVFPHRRKNDGSAEAVVKRLIAAFEQPFQLGTNEATIGVSVGISHFLEHGSDADSLMANADIAMYAAKTAGKNHARVFSPALQATADQRHLIVTELRKVLNGGGIELAYQPKICATTGAPSGCEALARWRRDDGSMVSPAEFIPVAEQSGLILPLGEHIISKAIETSVDWAARQVDLLPIAVNISPKQLRSVNFVPRLMSLIEEYQADPQWIDLEITENAVVEDIDHAIETINRLCELGFRVAIDDFGTGYSSLSYLRHFRVHALKIDRSFIMDVTSDRNSAAIVSSIVSLGHGLDLSVIAEGVEDDGQQQFLTQAGCDVLQGYKFSRPIVKQEIETWLAERRRN